MRRIKLAIPHIFKNFLKIPASKEETIMKLGKRALSLALALVMMVSMLPLITIAAGTDGNPYYNRVADTSTMDNWTKYFDLRDAYLNTANAGGVWTDKSVFTDASAFPQSVQMENDDENFLTALSALAANKEVVGYSTIPTDTVLVLDLSNSMDGYENSLISAANEAIETLLETNENNRVGVVLYSGHNTNSTSSYSDAVTRILPVDRYTPGNNGTYLTYSGGNVSVSRGVSGESNPNLNQSKAFRGATYMQAGLWEAMEMFLEMDTVITENNWQNGDDRMPILVLMSDGAPTTGTSYYDDVENSNYRSNGGTVYKSNVGDGSSNNLQPGNVFLTQLTAAYVMNRIENHYQQQDSQARGLFYTLGFNVRGNQYAESVLDPDSSTLTDSLWNSYNALTTGNLSVRVKGRNGSATDVSIHKNSYVTGKSYVDDYFSASGNGLQTAFRSIVDEIILQSRYYPTHLEGGSPDFSGYVEFTDTLGEYMEVKDIKGILLGDVLYDGHMMASKLSSNAEGGLGTVENPTELGHEFIGSVKARLGIGETAEAQALVAKAFAAGQLKYVSATNYSNHIGWYAKADGSYAGFWDENANTAAPTDAVYKIKSYGFLGETTGSIKNSDMMYMSVQVRTHIATGQQTVIWRIPAALVPMITYLVTLDGKNINEARNVDVKVENVDNIHPIRLIFESGLRSDLNELNIDRITDASHLAEDGVTRRFWTNYFDISAASHDQHITTMSAFTPSLENERFYYTENSAVYKKVGENYVLVGENETFDSQGEYYHRRYIFKKGASEPVFFYEKMSAASIAVAVDEGWNATFEPETGVTGAWVVPAGTPARELQMYDERKADSQETDPVSPTTKSAKMVFHPYLAEQNGVVYVDMNLGNNGLLEVTPAQGIKLSKTVDVFETGTSDQFQFEITLRNADGTPFAGNLDSYITDLDVVPLGTAQAITVPASGTYTVELSRDQTFWLTGLPAGVHYGIREVSDNDDYKVKSVHVNGVSTGTAATGYIAANFIDRVDFVNTAVGLGDLVITKQVVDTQGNPVDVSDNLEFTAEVTLTNAQGAPVSGTFGNITVPANGKFTVTLGDGESVILRDIPEFTRYSVVETNIPAGFAFNGARSNMTGVVDADSNDQALIVNTYQPTAVGAGNIAVEIYKEISGNRTQWLTGESYSFTLERVDVTRGTVVVDTAVIDHTDADKKAEMDMTTETYSVPGTYYYRITEATGTQGGVTYDTAERRFHVVVADQDMDGDLEIVSVSNQALTTVTGAYLVTARFNNVYRPTGTATVNLNVQKKMTGNHGLAGFQFALYNDAALTEQFLLSTVTNAAGQAQFTLSFAANRASMAGEVYTYYMAELPSNNPNITDSTAIYKVEVTVKDNGDGTITATPVVTAVSGGAAVENGDATFTNVYTPSASDYLTITGKKEISGDRVLNANEFAFTITAETANAPLPATTTVKNQADGAFTFAPIEFTQVGTFDYIISEVQTDKIGGFTYDQNLYRVRVAVVDNGDATLTATITAMEKVPDLNSSGTAATDILFTNIYDAQDAEVTLTGTKLLTGKELQAGEFDFRLTPVTTGAPMPVNATVANDDSGHITFGKITYNKAGTYVYKLTEIAGTDSRYTYDNAVYTITVIVTDNSQGVLSAQVHYEKNGIAATEVVFRNAFTPAPITYDIHTRFGGEKVLNGRALEENEFEFALINAINGQQVGNTVKNDGNGDFRFPAVTLTTTGIYHYKITEQIGDEKGITYDTSSFHIRLEVQQDASGNLFVSDAQLHKGTTVKEEVGGVLTEVTRYDNITVGGQIVFTNTYKADPVYVTLTATKTLSGRDLVNGEFKFDLHATDDTYTYSDNTLLEDDVRLTLNDNGTGNIAFLPIGFEAVGTHHYVIVEDEVNGRGVTCDTTVYKVKIVVTDDLAGNHKAKIYVNDAEVTTTLADTVIFANTYKAEETDILIRGMKTLDGRELKAGEFSFALYDADGKKLETVKNDKDGNFAFAAIPVDTAGVYTYTVREVQGNAENVTYDKTVYTVKVTVKDNLDGTLSVSYAYTAGEKDAERIAFVNHYTAPQLISGSDNQGDTVRLNLWFTLLGVSAAAIAGIFLLRKKEIL